MRLLLLLLLPSLLCAQREDSLSLHRNVRLAWQPHRCINSAGLYGYVDSFHRVLAPFEYEKLDAYFGLKSFTIARKKGLFGALDAAGKTILPFIYTEIREVNPTRWSIRRSTLPNQTGLMDARGQWVIAPLYNYFFTLGDSLIGAASQSAQGVDVYAQNGELVRSFKGIYLRNYYGYDHGCAPNKRLRILRDTFMEGKNRQFYGLMEQNLQVILPPVFSKIEWESGDWAYVWQKDKNDKGLYQFSSKTFFPLPYTYVQWPDEAGNFVFQEASPSLYGLLNQQLKVIFPPRYRKLDAMNALGQYVVQCAGGQMGVLDTEGNILLDTIYAGLQENRKDILKHYKDRGPNYADIHCEASHLLPLRTFWHPASGQFGVWHHTRGLLHEAVFEQARIVNDTIYILRKNNQDQLWKVGRGPVSAAYPAIVREGHVPFLLGKNADTLLLLGHEGEAIAQVTAPPSSVSILLYAIQNEAGKYAVIHCNSLARTDFIFDEKPEYINTLPEEMRADISRQGQRWELWGRSKGKIYLLNAKLALKVL